MGVNRISPLPPPVDIVKSPEEFVIVDAEPATSNLAPGAAVPIPTLPLAKTVNSLSVFPALSISK